MNTLIEKYPETGKIAKIVFSADNIIFDIELRGHLTILEGNSSTGKTYFLNELRNDFILNEKYYFSNGIQDVKLINIFTKDKDLSNFLLKDLKDRKDRLILIDNADTLLTGAKELIKFISIDIKNQYVINARMGLPFTASFNHYGELRAKDNKIYTHFNYNVPDWM